jgi:hypothetical protein
MSHHHDLDGEGVRIHQVGTGRVRIENDLVGNPVPILILGLFFLVIPTIGPMGKVDRKAIGQDLEHLLGRDDIKLLRKEIEAQLMGNFLDFFVKDAKTF